LPVHVDRQSVLDWHHREVDAAGVCRQSCGGRELFDEAGNEKLLPILNALCAPDFGE